MDTVRFVKSFSRGQITIPKQIRKAVGLKDDFWLKVTVEQGKIIAVPVESEQRQKGYVQRLLTIKGGWFSQEEYRATRAQVEKRLQNLHGQNSS